MRIVQEVLIKAKKEKVFDTFVDDVGAWWGSPFLCTEKPSDIIFEKHVGGRFYEKSGENGEGWLWATVSAYIPNERVELRGPIGMSEPVSGVVSIEFQEEGSSTTVKLTHWACGPITQDNQDSYSWGWGELLGNRLKKRIETGERLGLKK
jgi:uncharacterized protein YndB with AHSA1/START domain